MSEGKLWFEEEEEARFAGVKEVVDDEQGASCPLPARVGGAMVDGVKSSVSPWSDLEQVAAPTCGRVTAGRLVSFVEERGVVEEVLSLMDMVRTTVA